MALHKNLGSADVHVIYAFEYADAAARTGATGLLPADVGKIARQLDNESYWILTSDDPVLWAAVSSTDPFVNPMNTWGDVIFGGQTPAGVPSKLPGVLGAYLRSGGAAGNPTFVRTLDVSGLVADASVGASLHASAILQANSTTKGFLPPRMTHVQMEAIVTPTEGLTVYATDADRLHVWDGTAWRGVDTTTTTIVTVRTDGSGDFTGVQAAIDSILDAATDKRYVVDVASGTYVGNVALKDYVVVRGRGWDSVIEGTVTADAPVEMTVDGIHIESTNAPAIVVTNAGVEGELDLLGVFALSTWDETAPSGTVRCTLHQDSGILYLYRECECTLTVEDTVNTAPATQQAVVYLSGSTQIYLESFNTWCEAYTDNPGNRISLLCNENSNVATEGRILGYGTTFYLTGSAHANEVHGVRSVGNGFLVLHDTYLFVNAPGANTAEFYGACSIGAPVGCSVVVSQSSYYNRGVADANAYIGTATTATDVVMAQVAFYLLTDVQPGRDSTLGALGSFSYQCSNNFGTSWSSGLFNGAERNADVTDWTNVSAALGGQAGANANYVFKSNGSGGGAMGANKQVITRRLTVGLTGSDVDYNSIKAAVDAAIAGGCSAASPWQIDVYPGTYTESPMSLVPGMSLVALQNRMTTVFIVAANAAEDLFTCTGGYMAGFAVKGVTDAAKALFRCATAYASTAMHGIHISGCSTGWAVSGGHTLFLNICSTIITGPGQGITTWASVTGTGSYLGINCAVLSCVAALLPYYAGNPIQTVYRVADNADCFIAGAMYRVAPKNATADIILADGGSRTAIMGAEIANSGNAVHIGAGGSNTQVTVTSVVLTNNLLNIFIESATGAVYAQLSTDIQRKSVVAGGTLVGLIQYRDEKKIRVVGKGSFRYDSGKDVEFDDYFYDFNGTGLCEGGAVTAGTGLHVDVATGEGWIRRGDPYFDAFVVEWAAVTALDLTASTTNYVYYDSEDATVKVGLSAPGLTGLLLATVVTDGSGIRFLHDTRSNLADLPTRLHDYLLTTRKFAANSGLSAVQGTGATKLSVGSGSYYLALELISYAGSGGDATWSYFYGTNGATEVASVNTLNTTQYDSAGTLTAMTASYYRADTLYLTSDGRLSLIYGTAQYATQALAEVDGAVTSPPTFTAATACRLAQVVVQQGVGIASIVDRRPNPGATIGGGGGGGSSSHSALSDLDKPADHTWAMLVDGTRSMTGGLNMGGQAITNVGNVDGVDVSAHGSRHNPGGSDALGTAAAATISVGATPAEGSASSYARSDHVHGLAAATPSDVGTANAAGSAGTVSRGDHVHAHGTHSVGTNHAAAVAGSPGTNGFITGANQLKLDGIAAGATNTALATGAPANVTKATAAVGVATDAARSDHKHDVTTAAAGTLTFGSAAEGASSSLARADHAHALTAPGAPANVTKAAAAAGTSANVAREDHKHDVTTAAASSTGAANAEGSASSLARSDHVHLALPVATHVEEDTTVTTTSGTDVLLSGMTITPVAGNYLVWFSGDCNMSNTTNSPTFSIYAGGTLVSASQRNVNAVVTNGKDSYACQARVTVNGAQAIEGRWRRANGTTTSYHRSLTILRVL